MLKNSFCLFCLMMFYVSRLARKQLQIIYGIVACISVDVMHYFGGRKIALELLFHKDSMFKRIFGARLSSGGRVGIVVRNVYLNIPLCRNRFPSLPTLAFFFSSVSAAQKCRIICCQIKGRSSATLGAIFTNFSARVFPKWFTTLGALLHSAPYLRFCRTYHGAVAWLNRRKCLVLFSTLLTGSSYHGLNSTRLWWKCQ